MRPRLFLLSLVLPLAVLAGCTGGDSSQTTPADPAPAEEEQVSYERREGTVRPLGASIYEAGTHRLEAGGELVALLESASPRLSLADFEGQEVELEGIVRPLDDGLELVSVVALTPAGQQLVGNIIYRDFIDSDYSYGLSYPSVYTARQTRSGVSFYDDERQVIALSVVENTTDLGLLDFLLDRYGYTNSQLNPVQVAGLPGFRFENETGQVIYLGRGGEVIALAWLDSSEDMRARDQRLYLEMVQSLNPEIFGTGQTPADGLAGAGETCGGIDEIGCASGLSCEITSGQVGSTGVCVAGGDAASGSALAALIAENTELPALASAELHRGWYYGDTTTKKPATPDSWILVDSGTRFAMWRRPHVEVEYTPTLPEATADIASLSSSQQLVLGHLRDTIDTIAPEAPTAGTWQLQQLALVDPSYAYATYRATEQTRRLLVVYSVVGTDVTIEKKAYQKPGPDNTWILLEGRDTASGTQTIVHASPAAVSTQLAGYRSYTNTHHSYTLQYPADWYWQNIGVFRTEFSDTPFPAGIARITTQLVDAVDQTAGVAVAEGEETVIYAAYDDEKLIRIAGDAAYTETMEIMASTVTISQ